MFTVKLTDGLFAVIAYIILVALATDIAKRVPAGAMPAAPICSVYTKRCLTVRTTKACPTLTLTIGAGAFVTLLRIAVKRGAARATLPKCKRRVCKYCRGHARTEKGEAEAAGGTHWGPVVLLYFDLSDIQILYRH